MSHFLPIWVVFWYIQGAEVELGVINSTSAPCTYQKKLSQVYLEWNIDEAFSKNQQNTTKQKVKITKKLNFDLRCHFWSFLVTSGRVFSHQKIVSSLFCNILEPQSCSVNHIYVHTRRNENRSLRLDTL